MLTIPTDAMAPGVAARRLGISPRYLQLLIERGRIPAVRTPLGHLLSAADVENLATEREQRH